MFRRKYLQEGEQTQLTPLVMKHVERIKVSNFKMSFRGVPVDGRRVSHVSYKTCDYISKLPYISGWKDGDDDENNKLKGNIFRKRTLNDVLEGGIFPTCSDVGILFRGFMIAQGFPVAYVEGFHEDLIFGRKFHGHIFGRVFYNGKFVIVDPSNSPSFYTSEEALFKDKHYVVFDEGLDSWGIGIRGYKDMVELRSKNLKRLRRRHGELCDATGGFVSYLPAHYSD